MLHAKFQNHTPSGSEEQGFYRCLLLIATAVTLVRIYDFVHHLHVKCCFDYANGFRDV